MVDSRGVDVLDVCVANCRMVSVERVVVFVQAEDGIRDLVRSRGLGDVYKRQLLSNTSGRQANRGMEGLAISPDGNTLIGIMQNALLQDNALTPGTVDRQSVNTRILTVDLFTGETHQYCLLYTSDAADERSSVDLGGRRIIKKKNTLSTRHPRTRLRV